MDDYEKILVAIALWFDEVEQVVARNHYINEKFVRMMDYCKVEVEYTYEVTGFVQVFTVQAAITVYQVSGQGQAVCHTAADCQHHVENIGRSVQKVHQHIQTAATRLYWVGWHNKRCNYRKLPIYSSIESVLENCIKLQTDKIKQVHVFARDAHVSPELE